jgi:two-component system OmpR family response regulator
LPGWTQGADDYLGKPFDLAEVEARLRALVRRTQGTDDLVQVGELRWTAAPGAWACFGPAAGFSRARVRGAVGTDHAAGRVISKRMMSQKLSEYDEALGDNALEAFISRLRKKLQGSGVHIRTCAAWAMCWKRG